MAPSFEQSKTIEYWLEGAMYDLETGRSLLQSKRYPYALFLGHMAIEKALKALVVKETGEHAPYTHSLIMLIKKTNIQINEDIINKLAEYTEFNIEARYPDENKAFYEKCTEKYTVSKFAEMEDFFQWLIQKSGK